MTQIKLTLFLMAVTTSLNLFAGGTGGGGVLLNKVSYKGQGFNPIQNTRSSAPQEMIYHISQTQEGVHFAYAYKQNGQWQAQSVEVTNQDLLMSPEITQALETSMMTKSWVEIQ